jgi:hypothetical protein
MFIKIYLLSLYMKFIVTACLLLFRLSRFTLGGPCCHAGATAAGAAVSVSSSSSSSSSEDFFFEEFLSSSFDEGHFYS